MDWTAQMIALRLAASVHAPRPHIGERAARSELQALVDVQLEPWRGSRTAGGTYLQHLAQLNATEPSVGIVEIRAGTVRIWDKPPCSKASDPPERARRRRGVFEQRALFYRVFLQGVVQRHSLDIALTFPFDFSDGLGADTELPLFGFQRRDARPAVLLPDPDFFYLDWYARVHDARAYDDKKVSACFVGASTGEWMDERAVRESTPPRLRAARYFHGHPRVQFRIAEAVQCDTEATRECLMSQPYFGERMDWPEQLEHRFLISMDGNGAACSRLVVGLRSHSAVIKYDSRSMLYYFPALRAGREYIEVSSDAEVESVIERELRAPGHYRDVALAGRRFAEHYLNVHSVMEYTAMLLAQCAQ